MRSVAYAVALSLFGLITSVSSAHAAGDASAWVYSPLRTSNGRNTADARWSYNDAGKSNWVERTGTGVYTVGLPGYGAGTKGNVQVNAYGTGNARCKVQHWGPHASDSGTLGVKVLCFNGANPADSAFSLFYFVPGSTSVGFHFWSDALTTAAPDLPRYPNDYYAWDSEWPESVTDIDGHNAILIWRIAKGRYELSADMEANGSQWFHAPMVTAYGSDSVFCNVASVPFEETYKFNAEVRCYAADGSPADSRFTFSGLYDSHYPISLRLFYTTPTLNAAWGYSAPFAFVLRLGRGSYRAIFDDTSVGYFPGDTTNMQVVALTPSAASCKVVSWGAISSTDSRLQVYVACMDAAGTLVDVPFSVRGSQYTPPIVH